VTQALRLATRGSPLARAQTASVAAMLRAAGVASTVVVVVTEGDRRVDAPLDSIAGQGVFTKEVQSAVLDGRADVAVHSAKDLPPITPDGLVLAAIPERLDPADALVGSPLLVLGPGATVATGAPRRRALLLAERPDLDIVALRGNIATRLEALERTGVRAVVVAMAALLRLGLEDRVTERLDPERFVPQVGQGAIALECAGGSAAHEIVQGIDDRDAHRGIDAERAFLAALGAGCELPGGALATIEPHAVVLRAVLLSQDGELVVRGTERHEDPVIAGGALAARLAREFEHLRSAP
jgi:hydroxymethylbilane synthase